MFCDECCERVCLRRITSKEHISHILSILIENQCHSGGSEETEEGFSPTFRCIAFDLQAQMTQKERRQETEQFVEIIKTEVLEEKSKQTDILKKFWVVLN